MKRVLLLLFALAASVGLSLAQERTVTGVVTDAATGEPLPLVNIQIKGTQHGTVTDNEGRYTLRVPGPDATLVFFSMGYANQEVVVGQQSTLNVALGEALEEIDQVVVVAYGTVKKESLVGSQGAVASKDLEKRPLTNVSSALAGSVSGIQMSTGTGLPGAGAPSMVVRGIGSINASAQPLIIVDGAPYGGSLSNINMSDVQSLTVLKDAASTALYGSSAGNGVVMITTKSGAGAGGRACDAKPNFSFTTTHGISMRGMSRYEKLGPQDFVRTIYDGIYNGHVADKINPDQAWLLANRDLYNGYLLQNPFKGVQTFYDMNLNPVQSIDVEGSFPLLIGRDGSLNEEISGLLWPEDLDWEKELYQLGYRQEYSLSGGLSTKRMRSFVSLGYLNERGYRIKTHFQRFSARLNLSYDINKYITLGTNLSYVYRDSESPKSDGDYSSNPFNFITYIGPIYPIHKHNWDGSYVYDKAGQKVFDSERGRRKSFNGFNPVQEADLDLNSVRADVIGSRSFLRLNLYEGLTFSMNFAYDLFSDRSSLRFNSLMGDQTGVGILFLNTWRGQTMTFNQLLQYKNTFAESHEVDLLLGHENYEYLPSGMEGYKSGESFPKIDEFANYSTLAGLTSTRDLYRKEGYFLRAAYSYKSRYSVSASYRYDGSSRFALDKQWGHFWSAGVAWNIGNEDFMGDARNVVSMLKLRASVGQTGVDAGIGYYPAKNYWNLGAKNSLQPGLWVVIGNKDLLWEKQTSYDLAVDFSFWNRLTGSVEFFVKASDDLIFPIPLPLSAGLASQNRNVGKMVNMGLEFDLTGTVLQMENVRWDLKLNGTFVRNRVTRLPEQNREEGIIKGSYKLLEGKSRYEFFLEDYIGIDERNGRPIYRLDPKFKVDPLGASGDSVNWTSNKEYAMRHFCGSSLPKLYGGFGTTLTAYGVDFGMLFNYQIGGLVYDGTYGGLMDPRVDASDALHKDVLKAWKKPGDKTNVPVRNNSASYSRNGLWGTDYYLIDGSSLMLKSVTLGYTFPDRWLEAAKISRLRVGISAENLFLLSRRKGLNPMQAFDGSPSGIEFEFARTITGSISFNF